MNNKKQEFDTLEKIHIHDLWRTDIEKMLECLTEIEEREEEERLQAGGVKNDGKRKKKKAASIKQAVQDQKKATKKGEKAESIKVPKAKPTQSKKDPMDMSLKDRLALKQKGQLGI